ncbi:Uncharcterized protein, DUF927 family [Noviherbaspirillum humi]|uniref:Uncharcterized protein, DUF927 family n=1 Tax=Noviherbaspirillum humi TaxID=1688639 RepID=A0A239LIF8_9BURK|nr:DUF927 domain-containing protein [Noviherbaspirillum humi]SNT30376.1 Uncharcterized protein, DUF927 family [Noviherbaspirillum humi]
MNKSIERGQAILASMAEDPENRLKSAAVIERLEIVSGYEDAKAAVTGVADVKASENEALDVSAGELADVTAVTSAPKVVLSVPDDERPCFRVVDVNTELQETGFVLRPGVWHFGIRVSRQDGSSQLTQQWACSPLHIEAITRDENDAHFGRKLRFVNSLDQWRTWSMPMELLKGNGEELRGELLSMGVHIDPNGHKLLGQYLQSEIPQTRLKCTLQVGWCGNAFVLPNRVIGPDADQVIFQTGERYLDEYAQAGTLEGWQTSISARASGNPLLLLSIAASFAGPLLAKCHADNFGIHFVGNSSTGKTTLVTVSSATWGGPGNRRSWRATANGMEGIAALFNDGLLVLDEISECNPREVGAIVYMLANGHGKQRARRSGSARSVQRWRCIVLSTGERTIATSMEEGGEQAKAGQAVRLLDISVERIHGAWDDLHDTESGAAFSDALRQAAATNYGHAGPAFLQKLAEEPRDLVHYLEKIKSLPQFQIPGAEGQEKRAAQHLALIALAGELATEFGVTGWREGEALEAAAEALKLWHDMRGSGNSERRDMLGQLQEFIDRHGDSRFSSTDPVQEGAMRHNRAGWWRESANGRQYLFTATGMREALKGFDFKRALKVLAAAGVLPPPNSSGEHAQSPRIQGQTRRVYIVNPDRLED